MAAFTETGLESISNPEWYTSELLNVLKNKQIKIAYVLVWRNACDSLNHYYAPFPGHPACDDFRRFTEMPEILMCKDIKN